MRTGILLVGVFMFATQLAAEVRRPAVAGSFYTADAARLGTEVRRLLGTR
ncbi:MAG: hypothetical protein HRF46_14275, partial [Acidobacteriota bacterium]